MTEQESNSKSGSAGIWIYAIPAVVLAVLAAFFYRGLYLSPGTIEPVMVGRAVPSFVLPRLRDETAVLASDELAGRYVLVNFWATWCVGCRQEHEFLLRLSRSGVPIYGVNWKDNRDEALEWLATLGDPYVASVTDYVGDVAIDFGVYGAPETFLIAPDNTIVAKLEGPLNEAIWARDFQPRIDAGGGGD